jgi:tetratricopeptide (TPR) repeat protein
MLHIRARFAGDMIAWTNRGLELAERFEAARYWRGTLLLNLGDWQWEHGEPAKSLAAFEAALEAREQESRDPSLTEEARYGVARALRALGRPLEAVPLLEQAVRWVEETDSNSRRRASIGRSSPQRMTTSADPSKPLRSAQRLRGPRTDRSLQGTIPAPWARRADCRLMGALCGGPVAGYSLIR